MHIHIYMLIYIYVCIRLYDIHFLTITLYWHLHLGHPFPGSSLIGLHAMDTLEAPVVPLLVGSPKKDLILKDLAYLMGIEWKISGDLVRFEMIRYYMDNYMD